MPEKASRVIQRGPSVRPAATAAPPTACLDRAPRHDRAPFSAPAKQCTRADHPDMSPLLSHARRLETAPYRRHCARSEEHTSELQSRRDLVCRLLLEKKKKIKKTSSILKKKKKIKTK